MLYNLGRKISFLVICLLCTKNAIAGSKLDSREILSNFVAQYNQGTASRQLLEAYYANYTSQVGGISFNEFIADLKSAGVIASVGNTQDYKIKLPLNAQQAQLSEALVKSLDKILPFTDEQLNLVIENDPSLYNFFKNLRAKDLAHLVKEEAGQNLLARLLSYKNWNLLYAHAEECLDTLSNISRKKLAPATRVLVDFNDSYLKTFHHGNHKKGIEILHTAERDLQNVQGHEDIKVDLAIQLAQAYIYYGDRDNANKVLTHLDEKNDISIVSPKSLGFYYFIKAKTLMELGKLPEALAAINSGIEKDKKNLKNNDIGFLHSKLMKAEILYKMKDFKNLSNVLTNLQHVISQLAVDENHELKAKYLVLKAAQLLDGKKFVEAKGMAEEGLSILQHAKKNDLKNLDLCLAYLIHGEIFLQDGKTEVARTSFKKAQNIYDNVNPNFATYTKSLLLQRLSAAALKQHYAWEASETLDEHHRLFGPSDNGTIEIKNKLNSVRSLDKIVANY